MQRTYAKPLKLTYQTPGFNRIKVNSNWPVSHDFHINDWIFRLTLKAAIILVNNLYRFYSFWKTNCWRQKPGQWNRFRANGHRPSLRRLQAQLCSPLNYAYCW